MYNPLLPPHPRTAFSGCDSWWCRPAEAGLPAGLGTPSLCPGRGRLHTRHAERHPATWQPTCGVCASWVNDGFHGNLTVMVPGSEPTVFFLKKEVYRLRSSRSVLRSHPFSATALGVHTRLFSFPMWGWHCLCGRISCPRGQGVPCCSCRPCSLGASVFPGEARKKWAGQEGPSSVRLDSTEGFWKFIADPIVQPSRKKLPTRVSPS